MAGLKATTPTRFSHRSLEKVELRRQYEKSRYQKNKKTKISQVVRRQRERYAADPEYALYRSLRSRMRYALKSQSSKASGRCMQLIGCTSEQLLRHIESQFLDGMSWSNRIAWHIDHIIPVSAFNLSTVEGQQSAFHYTNLRPVWAKYNRAKSAKPPSGQYWFSFGYVALSDRQKARARKGSVSRKG